MPGGEGSTNPFRRVVVVGAGTMGVQVGLQCAAAGCRVALYDLSPEVLKQAQQRTDRLLREFSHRLPGNDGQDVVRQRLIFTADPAQAAEGADWLSESVTEKLSVKRQVLRQFEDLCPPSVILTTNSSFELPSAMSGVLQRPERLAAFHFHQPAWKANVVDIMPHPGTSPQVVQSLVQFARHIGQIAIVLQREQPGYVFNTMLWHWLNSALTLAEKGVTDLQTVDLAWMGITKMPIGPFGVLDLIGLDLAQRIISQWGFLLKDPQFQKNAEFLARWTSAGRSGFQTNHGFYDYPHPEYRNRSFWPVPCQPDDDALHLPHPAADTPHPIDRFRLVPVEAPLHARLQPQVAWQGKAWVMGPSKAAECLIEKIQQSGGQATQLPEGQTEESLLAWLDQDWSAAAAPHLFILSAWHPHARTKLDISHAWQRYSQGVWLPYRVCQKWFQLAAENNWLDRCTLTAATALGGDFGLSGHIQAAEGGGLAGLLKAVQMEGFARDALGPQVRAVDFSAEVTPELAARHLLCETAVAQAAVVTGNRQEMQQRQADLEIGYRQGTRLNLRATLSAELAPSAADIQTGGVWVVSGGGRGITAQAALHLGKKYGLKLHLLGRSPLPQQDYTKWSPQQLQAWKTQVMKEAYAAGRKPNEAWAQASKGLELQQTLQAYAAAGVSAQYHLCDVSDPDSVAAALQEVRQASGPIFGILHGAGVEETMRFERKTPPLISATLAPKYLGTLALMTHTQADPLRHFISFGSLAGRFGGVGQTDYSMANDLLAKLTGWFRQQRPDCRSLTILWPGWRDLGMAARPASRFALEAGGYSLISPDDGLALLHGELSLGCPLAEVMFIGSGELPTVLQTPVK